MSSAEEWHEMMLEDLVEVLRLDATLVVRQAIQNFPAKAVWDGRAEPECSGDRAHSKIDPLRYFGKCDSLDTCSHGQRAPVLVSKQTRSESRCVSNETRVKFDTTEVSQGAGVK